MEEESTSEYKHMPGGVVGSGGEVTSPSHTPSTAPQSRTLPPSAPTPTHAPTSDIDADSPWPRRYRAPGSSGSAGSSRLCFQTRGCNWLAPVYAIFCLGFAALAIGLTASSDSPARGLYLLFFWPALDYGCLAWSYITASEFGIHMYSKRANGSLPWWVYLVQGPGLVLQWLFWLAKHYLVQNHRENPYDLVSDGIYVGRFPLKYPSQFPVEAEGVIDLTIEYPARACVMKGRRYLLVPSMDHELPSAIDLVAAAHEASEWSGSIYVHCANGHGRSASMAALLMVLRGDASSWRNAFKIMKVSRPLVNIHQSQADVLDEAEALMFESGVEFGAVRAEVDL